MGAYAYLAFHAAPQDEVVFYMLFGPLSDYPPWGTATLLGSGRVGAFNHQVSRCSPNQPEWHGGQSPGGGERVEGSTIGGVVERSPLRAERYDLGGVRA